MDTAMALTAEEWPKIHLLQHPHSAVVGVLPSVVGLEQTPHSSPSMALTRLELSAGHGAARTVGPVGYWGESQVALNFYRGFRGWSVG